MYYIEYQANKIVKPCYFPILLWQLAFFRCGSWRFFVVAVGGIIASDTPLHNLRDTS